MSKIRGRVQSQTMTAISSFSYCGVFLDEGILGSGKSLMTHVLFTNDKYSSLSTSVFRIVGPIFCFTTGGSGGVFAPSLSAGAGIGSLLSNWFQLLPQDANVLILAGMAAFLTGVTRTPFTSAILVLEMTDRHNVIFHLMLAAMIASIVSLLIDRHSFYDRLKVEYIQRLHQEDNTVTTPSVTQKKYAREIKSGNNFSRSWDH